MKTLNATTITPGSILNLKGDYSIEGDIPPCNINIDGNLEIQGSLLDRPPHCGRIIAKGTLSTKNITGRWEIEAGVIEAGNIKGQVDLHSSSGDLTLGDIERSGYGSTLTSAGKLTFKNACNVEAYANGSLIFNSITSSNLSAACILGRECGSYNKITSTIGDTALDTVSGVNCEIRSVYDVRIKKTPAVQPRVKCEGVFLIGDEKQPKESAIEEFCDFGGGNCGSYLPRPEHKGCGILYTGKIGMSRIGRYSIPKEENSNADMTRMIGEFKEKGIFVSDDTLTRNGLPVEVTQYTDNAQGRALQELIRKKTTSYINAHRKIGDAG